MMIMIFRRQIGQILAVDAVQRVKITPGAATRIRFRHVFVFKERITVTKNDFFSVAQRQKAVVEHPFERGGGTFRFGRVDRAFARLV